MEGFACKLYRAGICPTNLLVLLMFDMLQLVMLMFDMLQLVVLMFDMLQLVVLMFDMLQLVVWFRVISTLIRGPL